MIGYTKLNKKIDQYYLFNKDTENDCFQKHVETVEEAKSFFRAYGRNLELGVEIVRSYIKSYTDQWQFWGWIGFMILAVALSATGSLSPIVFGVSVVAGTRCLNQVGTVLSALSNCKKTSREAEEIKNLVMMKGLTDLEILDATNSFINKHNRVWETQLVKEEIREKNNRKRY